MEEQWTGDAPSRERRGGGPISHRGIHWWPLPEAQLSRDVPAPITEAFTEAVTARAAGCPRAAAVMARRTLEAVVDDRGAAGNTLERRLAPLAASGVLVGTLADWATEVRLIGNAGAHFDPIQRVSAEDARQLVEFVQQLLHYVYTLPADLARRRAGGAGS